MHACTLDELALIAATHGFGQVTTKLLLRIAAELKHDKEPPANSKQYGCDHLFIQSLLMQAGMKNTIKVNHKYSLPILQYSRKHADSFYAFAQDCQAIQVELSNASCLDEVLQISKAHGFPISRLDIQINRSDWQEPYFPWSHMNPREAQAFMQTSNHKKATNKLGSQPQRTTISAD